MPIEADKLGRSTRSPPCPDQASAITWPCSLASCLTICRLWCRICPKDTIQQALWATGTATIRRRRLPAEQVVWLVLGMALFRRLNIVQVLDQLDLALPTSQRSPVVPSAIHQARARLGPLPLMWLFTATAQRWTEQRAHEDAWRGLTLYGVDGTTLRVDDSEENRAYCGGPTTHRGPCGYPICRLVALLSLRSQLVRATTFGPYGTDELVYAQDLWDAVPEDSLTLLDRRYFAAHVFYRFLSWGRRRHFLVRVKNKRKCRQSSMSQLLNVDSCSNQDRHPVDQLRRTWPMVEACD